jgi:hypothetical protein
MLPAVNNTAQIPISSPVAPKFLAVLEVKEKTVPKSTRYRKAPIIEETRSVLSFMTLMRSAMLTLTGPAARSRSIKKLKKQPIVPEAKLAIKSPRVCRRARKARPLR